MPLIQFNYHVSNPDSIIPLLVENNGHIYYPDGREITQHIFRNTKTNYSNPYKFIHLTHPVTGIRLRAQVSRIVCQAYHPIPNPELYQCDHKDNNPSNNTSSNLQWLSISGNNSRKHSRLMKSKHHKHTNHSHQCILARNLHTGETRIFTNGHHAAKELKCSHVLVYLAIQRIKTTHARSWELQWIDKTDPRAKDRLNELLK